MRLSRWQQTPLWGVATSPDIQFLRGRGFSGNTEQLWQKLPPAAFLPEDSPPSALSWMRRRLPGVPEGVLHRLFRKRDVKLISPTGARVAVRPDSKLLAGAVLAIPSSVQARERPDTSQTAGSRLAAQVDQLAPQIKEAVLHEDEDLLVLNKPAGMPVQGGNQNVVSLDQILRKHFRWRGQHPRLVHRLDADTSGALVVARSQEAAAWLAAAFARPAAAQADALTPCGPARIRKWYQAVVVGSASAPGSRTVTDPVLGAAGHAVPAETVFTTRRRAAGLAWLDCKLVTGRKHQIRIHCADALGLPVLGDSKYGRQCELTANLLALPNHAPCSAGLRALLRERHLFLHSSRVCIVAGQSRPVVDIEAPLPAHMLKLGKLVRWDA